LREHSGGEEQREGVKQIPCSAGSLILGPKADA